MINVAPAKFPEPLLTVVVDEPALSPPLLGLCAGYERGEWRSRQLAEYLMEWLLDFVFTEEELETYFNQYSARQAMRRAAQLIYQSDKYRRRGEFGELFLHVILRQYFGSLPAIRKIYFKDSANDTVKGFDAVHVVARPKDLELWLGEVKFYTDLATAITDVKDELMAHSSTDYLRNEFGLILNKLNPAFPHYPVLRRLLDPKTSLDDVFARIRVPVLLTYDSRATQAHMKTCIEYIDAVRDELVSAHASFARPGVPAELIVNLILVPLATKSKLLTALHAKLQGLQI